MVRYDPKALQQLADKLYSRTTVAVIGSAIAGVISGGLFGFAASLIFRIPTSFLLPGAIVGGVIGFFVGQQRARAMKVQAQLAACLIKIEENTRKDKSDA